MTSIAAWDLLCYNHGNRILHKLIHYIPDRIEHRDRWVKAIQRRDIPIRLIDAAADPISGAHIAKHYRELIPNANVVELEGIGHYPQVQAPTGANLRRHQGIMDMTHPIDRPSQEEAPAPLAQYHDVP
jgi:pimeloyl-ACP methyl ester carboxylesterase